jgi:hypothetical protein
VTLQIDTGDLYHLYAILVQTVSCAVEICDVTNLYWWSVSSVCNSCKNCIMYGGNLWRYKLILVICIICMQFLYKLYHVRWKCVTSQIRSTYDFWITISDTILITNRFGITRCWQVQPYCIRHHFFFFLSLEVLGRPVLVCLKPSLLPKYRINSTHRTLTKCWSVTAKFFSCLSLARATRMQKDNICPLLNSVLLIYTTVLATQNDNFPYDTGFMGILVRVWYEE